MTASLTCFSPSSEKRLALVAGSSDTLARLLMDEILASRLAWACKDEFLVFGAVVGLYRGVFAVGLDLGSSPLAAGNGLGLRELRWVTRAFGATIVVAVGAFLSSAKGSVAAMAGSSNAHSNGFVHAKYGIARDGVVPLHGLNLQAKSFVQLFGSLFKQLKLRELVDSGHVLIRSPRFRGFDGDMADTWSIR